MLGKLMKYEFKATSRMLLPINGAMLLFALINRLFMELNFFQTGNMAISALATVMAVMYVMVIIAAFVITLIVIIQRFYKNLLTDEGYLMFTLPVKAHSHITSKGIVAFVWYLASFVVCALSIFILVVDQNCDRRPLPVLYCGAAPVFPARGRRRNRHSLRGARAVPAVLCVRHPDDLLLDRLGLSVP